MQTLHLYEMAAFDAKKEHIFTFSWSGNQARGNRLTIRKNDDNTVVYSNSFTTMKLAHPLSANTLTNGICYNAYIEVLNNNGSVISDRSNSIVFYCYSIPSFTFSNLEENKVIENSYYLVSVDYSQTEDEQLRQYQIGLYDLSHSLVQTQGIQYLSSPANQVSAIIMGLEDNTSYYIRATGKTINGIELDTGYILITAKYIQPSIFSLIELKNIKEKGYISITSNFVTIRGTSNPPEDELKFVNGMVDLTESDSFVEFNEGFELSGDFAIGATFLGAKINLSTLKFGDGEYNANLYYREGKFESQKGELKSYFELQIGCIMGKSIITSEYVEPIAEDELYTVWILRRSNIYQVIVNKEV